MEEETLATEAVQADAGGCEGEAGAAGSNSIPTPTKTAGMPKGSKRLQVWMTHINLTDLGSNLVLSAGGSGAENTPPKRKRGRPKGGSGAKNASPRKRGRPKGSPNKRTVNKQVAGQNVSNGGPLKKGRGRPKGPTPVKRKADGDDGVSSPPRKRGRPKGSVNKKPRLAESREVSASNGDTPKRGRGRPKIQRPAGGIQSTGPKPLKRGRGRPRKDGSQPRGRGRPKGSPAKKPPSYKAHGKDKTPRVETRGRPRKHPLPSAEELKKPRVWKPLGRPRIHPRVDPAEEPPSTPHRGRGRPRKEESKKRKRWAHLQSGSSSDVPPDADQAGALVDKNKAVNGEEDAGETIVGGFPPLDENEMEATMD